MQADKSFHLPNISLLLSDACPWNLLDTSAQQSTLLLHVLEQPPTTCEKEVNESKGAKKFARKENLYGL